MRKEALLFGGIAVLGLLAGGVAHAGTQAFTATASGSDVDLPIDLDSDSCFTAPNGARVCTDCSGHDTFAGQRSPGGRFTGQNVSEYDPVSGTGCNIIGVGPYRSRLARSPAAMRRAAHLSRSAAPRCNAMIRPVTCCSPPCPVRTFASTYRAGRHSTLRSKTLKPSPAEPVRTRALQARLRPAVMDRH